MLRAYVKNQKYDALKVEELQYILTNLHPAQTDRMSSTSTYKLPEFNYEAVAKKDDCEKLANLYAKKVDSVKFAVNSISYWLRPQIILAYVKNVSMQKIAKEYGMNMIEMQRNFYKEIAKRIHEDWIRTDQRITSEIIEAEKKALAGTGDE